MKDKINQIKKEQEEKEFKIKSWTVSITAFAISIASLIIAIKLASKKEPEMLMNPNESPIPFSDVIEIFGEDGESFKIDRFNKDGVISYQDIIMLNGDRYTICPTDYIAITAGNEIKYIAPEGCKIGFDKDGNVYVYKVIPYQAKKRY